MPRKHPYPVFLLTYPLHDEWPLIPLLAKLSLYLHNYFLSWSCSSQWCRTDIQSHLALCITPLLEHFRMDRDRHNGGWFAPYVWPATRLDHLGSFSVEWNFYFNTELEPLNWKCSTNEPSNLYWEYFHTGRQFLINKILCLSSNSNSCSIWKSSICSGKRSP